LIILFPIALFALSGFIVTQICSYTPALLCLCFSYVLDGVKFLSGCNVSTNVGNEEIRLVLVGHFVAVCFRVLGGVFTKSGVRARF